MTRFIVSIFESLKQHRALRRLSLLLITAGLIALVLQQTYKEDISDFLPLNNKYQQALDVYQDFSGADRIITVFQFRDSAQADPDLMTEAIADFEQRLEESDKEGCVKELTTRIEADQFTDVLDFVYAHVPYFLSDEDYQRMDSLLADAQYIEAQIAADKQMLQFPVSGLLSENFQKDPLNLFTPAVTRLQGSQPNVNYELYDGYIFSADMTRAFVLMKSPYGASETENNARLLKMLRQVAEQTTASHPQIDVRYAGGPVIAVGNASQIKADSLLSVLLAVILIVALLYWVFRNTRNLLLIVLSIAWGWLFAMGLLSVFHHDVSVIVIGISSVILGIAVNYPLHLIAHLRHTPDIKSALKEIVLPLIVGNVTTVGAFLALVPLKSVALRDLGSFAAFLLIGTILFVLVYLPHLVKCQPGRAQHGFLDHVSDFSIENHRWIVIVVLLLTVVLGFFSFNTSFDSNMSHINYMTPQQKADMAYFQEMMTQSSAEQSVYLVSTDTTLEAAVARSAAMQAQVQQIQRQGKVDGYSHVNQFLPGQDEQRQRLERWNRFIAMHGHQLEDGVKRSANAMGFSQDSFQPFYKLLHTAFTEQDISFFEPLIHTVCSSHLVMDSANNVFHVVDALHVKKDLVKTVEKELESSNPSALIFDVESMNSSIATNLSNDFNYIGWACALIVFFFLWFSLGSIELALLSFLPMAISWVWILGIMSLFGIQFNVVNVILATFIFGQGDDYTIFMTEGCQYEYAYGRKMLSSYKNSIIVSALIMFIGIGTLIFAKHPALHSLAQVTIVGMFSVVLMAYLFPPLIFKWLIKFKAKVRPRPLSLLPLLDTAYCAMVFFSQLLTVYVLGFILMVVLKPTEARQKLLRRYIKRCFWIDMNHVPGVKFNLVNPSQEDFSVPSIIICNHQSMLDTAYLMAISDKTIILANQNVADNKIIKTVFKWIGFYALPTNGHLNEQHLAKSLQDGYSVVIFPEGERNDKSSILRFHKGAFHIAENYGCDVVPLFIHGVNHIYPRYTVCTYPGEVTLEIGSRIHPHDKNWGENYVEKTKNIHQFYIQHFEDIRRSKENTSYFKRFILDTYKYRGIEISTAVKMRMKRFANYSQWLDHWQDEDLDSTVIVINGGWGEFPLLLSMIYPQVNVYSFEQDVDKLTVSRQCVAPITNHVQMCDKNDTEMIGHLLSTEDRVKLFLIEPSDEEIETYRSYHPITISKGL